MCYIVIKGDRTMSLMSPAIYSSLFWELSRMEEFRNKRSIKDRCALLSQESPLPPDYNVRMYYVIRHTWWSEVTQSCPTLCNPVGCILPGCSVHGILQARILEWVAISFSRGIFPTQGSNPSLPLCRRMLPSEPPGIFGGQCKCLPFGLWLKSKLV